MMVLVLGGYVVDFVGPESWTGLLSRGVSIAEGEAGDLFPSRELSYRISRNAVYDEKRVVGTDLPEEDIAGAPGKFTSTSRALFVNVIASIHSPIASPEFLAGCSGLNTKARVLIFRTFRVDIKNLRASLHARHAQKDK
jgi:hypothetical protein